MDNLEGIEPLSLSQITPEIRLMASRCILADAESGSFSRDAHKYAAYTIIRENQLKAALAANRAKDAEVAELARKGRDLCGAYGNALIEIGNLTRELTSLRAPVGEK